MIITWYGQSCFKIQSGELTICIDPFSKEIGFAPPRFRADIVLVSHTHQDHANTSAPSGDPFLISGPGEYETKGVFILGIATYHDQAKGSIQGMNTMYRLEVEGISILHMGDFGEEGLRNETLDAIGDTDILMVPIGGTYTIDAAQAADVVKQIDPRFVIPMHYKIPGLKVSLADATPFLKEMGARGVSARDKFVVKKKDIGEEEKTDVVVLKRA